MPSENTEQRKLAAIKFTDLAGHSALPRDENCRGSGDGVADFGRSLHNAANTAMETHELNEQRAPYGSESVVAIAPEWLSEFEAAARRPSRHVFATLSSIPTNPCSTTRHSGPSTRRQTTGAGARRTCRIGWAMGAFEYRQAQEIRDCFQRHGIRYLFLDLIRQPKK